ncbi:Hypothetical predicted protein [Mytilus galloprovincialis]|uniref:C1q domain-containing protein n=1 Tax=Mytilus galloprovincialis TaxID=29158 RepID=A0A8B6EWW6_MYTGA|nr:Hypothetical predicted protein [Mytilus galloprovincialis]
MIDTCSLFLLSGLLVLYGVNTRAVQNITLDGSKLVTFDMWDALKRNMTELVTELIEHSKVDRQRVFFYANMPEVVVDYNKNSIVKFSNVLFNEGDIFNHGDGVFVSPVTGVYLFSWTILTFNGKAVNTELRVDNVLKETLHAIVGSAVGHISVSRTVICKVTKKEHVWIQTGGSYAGNVFDYDAGDASSFMGVLIYEI